MLKQKKRHFLSFLRDESISWFFVHHLFSKESHLLRVCRGVPHWWFITPVGTQTQTDWEWVEQSLFFSCLCKPCHHFRYVGGQRLLLYLAFTRFRHLSNFPITTPLCSSKGNWRSLVGTGRGGDCQGFKGHLLLAKNVIYANSHEVTPVDTVQEVMEYRSCIYGSLSSVSHSFLPSAGLVLYCISEHHLLQLFTLASVTYQWLQPWCLMPSARGHVHHTVFVWGHRNEIVYFCIHVAICKTFLFVVPSFASELATASSTSRIPTCRLVDVNMHR